MVVKSTVILAAFILVLQFFLIVDATNFGKNKLQTRQFDWQVFETDHFEIHYYPDEKILAQEVCQLAEEAYAIDTKLIRYKPNKKTPLFLYRNHIDFRQTNILPHIIGVGTGGFTEAFKNRIALPAPASPKSLKEVIIHEYIHALQFNILYGEGIRSFRVYKGYLIPLWIVEGMAEYASGRWSSVDNMILRDAVIHNRLTPLMLLEGFSHLEDVYLAYKQSQMVFKYISEIYGKDKIGLIFGKFKYHLSISQILRETLSVGLVEFNDDFMQWMNQRYWLETKDKSPLDQYGSLEDELPSGQLINTSGATWSPNGRHMAFVSNKDRTMRIYVKTRGKNSSPIAITNNQFEEFVSQGRPISWSPTSQEIVFIAQEQGKLLLNIINIKSKNISSHTLPLDGMSSPAWSPDGKTIALSGIKNGVADIYLWHINNKTLIPISSDRWLDATPCWSADGKKLIYSSEREQYRQLIEKEIDQTRPAILLTHHPSNHIQPTMTANGRSLYFINDRTGTNNLYHYDLVSKTTKQLSNVVTGIFQPTITNQMDKLTFTGYENGQWGIRSTALDTIHQHPIKATSSTEMIYSNTIDQSKDHIAMTSVTNTATHVIINEATNTTVATSAPVIKESYPYGFRFSPDLIFLLAGYDSSQGIVGGGYITASDYLGEHQFSFTSDFVPGYQARTILSYINYTFPIDIALAVSYSRNYYRIIDLETETMLEEFNDEEVGGGFQLSKAFSLFDRLEAEYSMQFLQREQDNHLLHKRLSRIRLSLIHDNTKWLDYTPSNGWRHNLSLVLADRMLGGEEQYQLIQLDSQAYQTLDMINPRLIFGARLFGAISSGPEHPVFLYGGIGILPDSVTIRGFRLGELLGSQLATLNLELRFPLARNIHYSIWPFDFLMMKHLQMVIFNDTGIVTNDMTKISQRDVKNTIGIGFRLHTFLLGKELLTIRFDIANRTDKLKETIYTWGIGQSF